MSFNKGCRDGPEQRLRRLLGLDLFIFKHWEMAALKLDKGWL